MKAKQFAWTHVLTNGKMNMHPAYYGGWNHIDKSYNQGLSYRESGTKQKNDIQAFLLELKTVGVDWNKTDDIQSETYSEFAGTFCDARDAVYLEGWITLKNGTKAFWCAENIDASDVFGMMENASTLIEKYTEIFGE
jgi:hypothetical protein